MFVKSAELESLPIVGSLHRRPYRGCHRDSPLLTAVTLLRRRQGICQVQWESTLSMGIVGAPVLCSFSSQEMPLCRSAVSQVPMYQVNPKHQQPCSSPLVSLQWGQHAMVCTEMWRKRTAILWLPASSSFYLSFPLYIMQHILIHILEGAGCR